MAVVKNYLSLIKFSHTVFALPFALIGYVLGLRATGFVFEPMLLVLVVLCMVLARTAAMAFNRYLDRRYDALNPRTAVREIPQGVISPAQALSLTIISSLLFIAATFFINPICFYLSPVAMLVVLGYSYTKRFTPLCHLVLGLGLSLAPIGAYLAVTGVFDFLPILFSLAVLFWVSGFDIIYALQDVSFDQSQELYSIPAALGKSRALQVSVFLHVMSALAVIVAGTGYPAGIWYWIGAAVFGACLIYQHSIVKPHDLSRVNLAFMTTNGIASIVFAAFVITDILYTSFG